MLHARPAVPGTIMSGNIRSVYAIICKQNVPYIYEPTYKNVTHGTVAITPTAVNVVADPPAIDFNSSTAVAVVVSSKPGRGTQRLQLSRRPEGVTLTIQTVEAPPHSHARTVGLLLHLQEQENNKEQQQQQYEAAGCWTWQYYVVSKLRYDVQHSRYRTRIQQQYHTPSGRRTSHVFNLLAQAKTTKKVSSGSMLYHENY